MSTMADAEDMCDQTSVLDSIIRRYAESRGMDAGNVRTMFDEIGMTEHICSIHEYLGHLNPNEMMDVVRDSVARMAGRYDPFAPWATHHVQGRIRLKDGYVALIDATYELGGRMVENNTRYEVAEV